MNISIKQLTRIKKYLPTFNPIGFLEIGSFDGTDAILVKDYYNTPAYAVEANVFHFNSKMMPVSDKINIYCFLASDVNGELDFHNINFGDINRQGTSSVYLYKRVYITNKKTKVEAKRIDAFLEEERISPNFSKIDVEGYAYEVLVGFGERIHDFRALQVETEEKAFWEGQKIHSDVDRYLVSKGFKLVEKFQEHGQNDCLYIKEEQ